MERNLDRIIKNINYHTYLKKENKEPDVLALLGFKHKSPRQIDMLNYHTKIQEDITLSDKIISVYTNDNSCQK